MAGRLRAGMVFLLIICALLFAGASVYATVEVENIPEDGVYVETVLSKEQAFLGEKVVLNYDVYSRYNVESFSFSDYPGAEGVVIQDTNYQPQGELIDIDGVTYVKFTAKQLILDPIKTGTVFIPPFTIQVNIIVESETSGDTFSTFFRQTQPVYAPAAGKALNVKPLPEAGRPDDFSGVVGEFRLDGGFNRDEVNYGDSLVLGLTASGDCNLGGLNTIFPGGLPGFTVYETLKYTEETVQGGKYYVKKEFEVILVPEKTGVLDAGPVSISYFNPVSGKYEKADIQGVAINVIGDMPDPVSYVGGAATGVEMVKVSQVSYTDTSDGYLVVRMKKQHLLWIAIGAAAVAVFVVVLVKALSKKKRRDPELKQFYKRLTASSDVQEIYDIFNAMIKHIYGLSLKASSQSSIKNRLPDEGLAQQVADIMGYMESTEEKEAAALKEKIIKLFQKASGC